MQELKTIVVIVLLSLTNTKKSVCEETFTFIPKPGPVDISEGETLSLEIEGTFKNQSICTATSNVYSCSFYLDTNVVRNVENNLTCDARIKHYGQYGRCKVSIEKFTENDPKQWTLKNNENETQILNVNVNYFRKANTLVNPILSMEGESYYQIMDLEKSLKITLCYLKFNDAVIYFDVSSREMGKTNTTEQSIKELSNRLFGLGNGQCGFKHINVNLSDPEKWVLIAEDYKADFYKAEFSVKFWANTPKHEIYKISMGDPFTIDCKHEGDFCTLYNPSGEMILKDKRCSYFIPTVSMDDIGKWKCFKSFSNAMVMQEHIIEISMLDMLNFETWNKSDGNTLSIGCQIKNINNKYSENFCVITTPSNTELRVGPSFATDRYSSVATNLKDNICVLEISLPLQDSENGIWTCQIGNYGGFIHIGNVQTTSYKKLFKKNVQLGNKLRLFCKVPFSSDYCHIVSPNGTQYLNEKPAKSWIGECSTTIQKASRHDHGQWKCLYARQTGLPDEEVIVEVKVAEQLTSYNRVEVITGRSAVLMCKTGLPIQYCRFISPNGLSYHLKESTSHTGINYYGRGLQYGDCGILIQNVKDKHAGEWKCLTLIGNSNSKQEASGSITLQINAVPFSEDPISIAGVVGGSIGVIVAAGVFAVIYIKRRRQTNTSQLRRVSNSSNESNSSQPIMQATNPLSLNDGENVIFQVRQRSSLENAHI